MRRRSPPTPVPSARTRSSTASCVGSRATRRSSPGGRPSSSRPTPTCSGTSRARDRGRGAGPMASIIRALLVVLVLVLLARLLVSSRRRRDVARPRLTLYGRGRQAEKWQGDIDGPRSRVWPLRRCRIVPRRVDRWRAPLLLRRRVPRAPWPPSDRQGGQPEAPALAPGAATSTAWLRRKRKPRRGLARSEGARHGEGGCGETARAGRRVFPSL